MTRSRGALAGLTVLDLSRVLAGGLMADVNLGDAAEKMLERGVTDPQVRHCEMVVTEGGYRMLGIPMKLDRTPGSVRTPPARRGTDTTDVLRSAGFRETEIQRLIRDGVVYQAAAELVS
ncbi:hypothetical protein MOQ72_20970 [Saccharopolyspora sp. K220]|uniref:hypothetical protein n=1 Tax=Saccharopolyspora soli TaxID=2926618 RepID=UPI001F58EB6C|nr:hypothetical protein [Saccharopolyspora soli]MCI2419923.1 hypothetical protein [Saccharopolyspora soli]